MNKLKVVNNSKTFPDDPIFNIGFEDCYTNNDQVVLHLDCHYPQTPNPENLQYLLDLELPNRWMTEEGYRLGLRNEERYSKIFCIDPFFTEHRNNQLGYKKYQTVFFPFDDKNIVYSDSKEYDVFYSGHIKADMLHIKDAINKFNGIIVANNGGISASYKQKLLLNSKAKISVVHNYLDMGLRGKEKDLFESLNCTRIVNNSLTQHKARVIEAAMLGSFMLCKKDEFNIVEDLFIPNEHFIYFSNKSELEELIQHILSNFEKYNNLAKQTAEYAKSRYTTQHFVNRFINNE